MTAATPPPSDSTGDGSGSQRSAHAIVVGGGIAGLVTAFELVEAGVRVTVVEASDRLGGKVRPHTVAGIELDAGAESFATRGGTVAALATRLGLGHLLVTPAAGGAWIQPAAGDAVPLPRAGLLGIPSVPLAKDVIAIIGLRGALRAQLDALLSGFVGSTERSLGRLVRKRMGRAVLDRLVTPIAGAIHSVHPDQLDVDIVAPRLRAAMVSEGSLATGILKLRSDAPAGSAVQGLAGGLHQLVGALIAELRGRAEVLLDTAVVEADPEGVTLADGIRMSADRVVLATELAPPPGSPITLATLILHASALDDAPRGTGVLVAPGASGIGAKALTHATAKWSWVAERAGGLHVVRLSYDSAPASDDLLLEQARADASVLLGTALAAGDVVGFDRVTWTGPASVDSPVRHRMAPTVTPPAESADTVSRPPSIVHIGERVAGTGLAAIVAHSRAAAESLLDDLDRQPGLRLSDT